MFCINCGVKLEKNSKFCYHCGILIEEDLILEKTKGVKKEIIKSGNTMPNEERETIEEFLAKTDIKSIEEARGYLVQIKILFWTAFLFMIFINALGESETELSTVFVVLYLIFLVYFIFFCAKVLKAERIPKSNAFWCIFFAPISWFYFYPLISDPLKIIVGEKKPPIRMSEEDRKRLYKEGSKKFWKRFWVTVGIIIGVLGAAMAAIVILS